ncbi:uncharacterized protein [Magallana gigas]|uniref:uncharacterized protein isoform X3 n=1 Tax=Magallana gigas TaxID=29159 RepID=UPI0033427C1D
MHIKIIVEEDAICIAMELLIPVIVTIILIKESACLCEDHFNKKKRVISMKDANCTWTFAEPEYNRVWMRVSVLQTDKDNSTDCQNYLMLEEIKDNKRHLLKRYCNPVARDYVKSNFNQILVTANNIKFKISWNGLKRKKKSFQTVGLHSTTERTSLQRTKGMLIRLDIMKSSFETADLISYKEKASLQTTNSVEKGKTKINSFQKVIGSSSGLLFVFVFGFITKKICNKRSNHISKDQTTEMNPSSVKTENKNCSHENSQSTSKKTRGKPNLKKSELSGSDKSNKMLGKTGIMRGYQNKGETNQSPTRSRRRADDYNKEHEYSLANFTGEEEEDHIYQECRFVNKVDNGAFCDAYNTSKTEHRHLSALSYESAEYMNLN